jgi:hypothetical protein
MTKRIIYTVMSMFACVVCATGCWLAICSKIAVEDTNLDVFRSKLSDAEVQHIVAPVWLLSWTLVAFLLITNLLWVIGVGIGLGRRQKNLQIQMK